MKKHPIVIAIIGGILLLGTILIASILQRGPRDISQLESIRGVPFVRTSDNVHVTETLAHADIQLHEPVLAKEMELAITFIPHNLKTLSVGIRQDPFWLSYNPIPVYTRSENSPEITDPAEVTLKLPLTSALQDTDRSVDIMFFADTTPADIVSGAAPAYENPAIDTTQWELVSMTATVKPVSISPSLVKEYIKTLIRQERPE